MFDPKAQTNHTNDKIATLRKGVFERIKCLTLIFNSFIVHTEAPVRFSDFILSGVGVKVIYLCMSFYYRGFPFFLDIIMEH